MFDAIEETLRGLFSWVRQHPRVTVISVLVALALIAPGLLGNLVYEIALGLFPLAVLVVIIAVLVRYVRSAFGGKK